MNKNLVLLLGEGISHTCAEVFEHLNVDRFIGLVGIIFQFQENIYPTFLGQLILAVHINHIERVIEFTNFYIWLSN